MKQVIADGKIYQMYKEQTCTEPNCKQLEQKLGFRLDVDDYQLQEDGLKYCGCTLSQDYCPDIIESFPRNYCNREGDYLPVPLHQTPQHIEYMNAVKDLTDDWFAILEQR